MNGKDTGRDHQCPSSNRAHANNIWSKSRALLMPAAMPIHEQAGEVERSDGLGGRRAPPPEGAFVEYLQRRNMNQFTIAQVLCLLD